MLIKKGTKGTKGTKGAKKGGGHSNKPVAPAPKNHLLNAMKMPVFKAPAAKKTQVKNKGDVSMSNTGSRQSSRVVKAPETIKVGFKVKEKKGSYVTNSNIPEKIKEYKALIKTKEEQIGKIQEQIKGFYTEIETLEKRHTEYSVKKGNDDEFTNLFSKLFPNM